MSKLRASIRNLSCELKSQRRHVTYARNKTADSSKYSNCKQSNLRVTFVIWQGNDSFTRIFGIRIPGKSS